MFPTDSLNVRTDFSGNVSGVNLLTIPTSSTYSILYESFNTGYSNQGANLQIDCGSTRLLNINDFSKVPQIERFKAATCTSNITYTQSGTTGNGTSTISIVYVPRNRASSSDPYPYTTGADFSYMVILLMVIAGILLLDLFRRLFTRS